MGTFQGTLALVLLFGTGRLTAEHLAVAAAVSASYWLATFGARLFPGTAWTDPEFEAITPMPLGFHPQQFLVVFALTMVGTAIGLALFAA